MKKIIAIIGARPQFIKHYPFERVAKQFFNLKTIHTGQHYDQNMSQVFFDELGMQKPDFMLEVGSSSHGVQTGKMMIEIEKIVLEEKPHAIIVYGDTNSTLAGSLIASKLHIPLVHIEAGLRSYNKKMPEEINRIMTDHISDLLLVPSEVAKQNLKKEGIINNVLIVGDIMKDLSLMSIAKKWIDESFSKRNYNYITLHRPYNVDQPERLSLVLQTLNQLDQKCIFSIHPRTRNAMKNNSMDEENYPNIEFINPQSYFSNLTYLYYANALITDSGGMQKEAYWLQKKCVTIRTETEWVETMENNWNTLLFEDLAFLQNALNQTPKNWNSLLYGSGDTADQITFHISELLKEKHSIEFIS
jgi:UDP-GlcNAc3NAcA epimerase